MGGAALEEDERQRSPQTARTAKYAVWSAGLGAYEMAAADG